MCARKVFVWVGSRTQVLVTVLQRSFSKRFLQSVFTTTRTGYFGVLKTRRARWRVSVDSLCYVINSRYYSNFQKLRKYLIECDLRINFNELCVRLDTNSILFDDKNLWNRVSTRNYLFFKLNFHFWKIWNWSINFFSHYYIFTLYLIL